MSGKYDAAGKAAPRSVGLDPSIEVWRALDRGEDPTI
jgi:hypothetical protein